MMPKITPCLWFDGNAEEAALFYVSLIPDSRINGISRSPADNPSTSEGAVLMVDFTLAGQPFTGLNGGPQFTFSEAISWVIDCADQAEVDRLWDALTEPQPSSILPNVTKFPLRCLWRLFYSPAARLLCL